MIVITVSRERAWFQEAWETPRAVARSGSVPNSGLRTDASWTVMSSTTPPPGTPASRQPRKCSGRRTAWLIRAEHSMPIRPSATSWRALVWSGLPGRWWLTARTTPLRLAASIMVWASATLRVQSEFNLKKGSAPVVKDASLDGYPDYQKKAAEAFQTKTIVSSLAHAQSAPAEFATTY